MYTRNTHKCQVVVANNEMYFCRFVFSVPHANATNAFLLSVVHPALFRVPIYLSNAIILLSIHCMYFVYIKIHNIMSVLMIVVHLRFRNLLNKYLENKSTNASFGIHVR